MEELRDFLLTVRLATEAGLTDLETAEEVAWKIVALSDEFRESRTHRDLYEE